jgi:hypothetical protein
MKNASLGIGLIGSDKQGAFLRGLRSLQYIELSNNKFTEPFTNEMLVSKYIFYCFSGLSGEVSENLKVLPEYG